MTQNKQYIEQHKKIHRTTQNKQYIEQHKKIHRTTQKLGRVWVVSCLRGFTLPFALQLRKKQGKTSVRVVRHKHTMRIHGHNNKNT
jgi:hypothetical protein